MSSAIEVLKGIKNTEIVVEDIAFNLQNEGYPYEEKDINNALDEAIVALEKRENYVIDFIRLEVLPKSKKEQFRVFFKDGTEQVFQIERVGEQK